MNLRWGKQGGGAGGAPLNANVAPDQTTPPRFDSDARLASDPHLARRAVDIRWLAALLSLATVAILMLGAVGVSLRSGLSVAIAPVFRHAATGSNLQRADRLPPVKVSREGDVIRSRIEQLADDGHSTTAFTHVIVRLARASGDFAVSSQGQAAPAGHAGMGAARACVARPAARAVVETQASVMSMRFMKGFLPRYRPKDRSHGRRFWVALSAAASARKPGYGVQSAGGSVGR